LPEHGVRYSLSEHGKGELFFVLEGRFFVDLEDRSIELQPWQGFTVPKGVVHRTRAPERAVILMMETASIVPTGDA